jgi:hypothetical protein
MHTHHLVEYVASCRPPPHSWTARPPSSTLFPTHSHTQDGDMARKCAELLVFGWDSRLQRGPFFMIRCWIPCVRMPQRTIALHAQTDFPSSFPPTPVRTPSAFSNAILFFFMISLFATFWRAQSQHFALFPSPEVRLLAPCFFPDIPLHTRPSAQR